MKVLVTGGGGQLATALMHTAPEDCEVFCPVRRALDVTKPSTVNQAFQDFGPDLVVNAAAYTAVDQAEDEPEQAFAINTDGARTVAEVAEDTSVRLVHISTDFVFDGRKSSPYLPEDAPHPLGVYGASKREGERLVLEAAESPVVLRTAWLYGARGHNFVLGMLRRMRDGQALRVVSDQVGTPTWTWSLALALWKLARQPELAGIMHFTDAGVASWYDFAVAIQEEGLAAGLLDEPVPITPVNSEDYTMQAERPKYSVLDKTRTWAALDITPVHWRTCLRDMLAELMYV